jgi:hypothetical protein
VLYIRIRFRPVTGQRSYDESTESTAKMASCHLAPHIGLHGTPLTAATLYGVADDGAVAWALDGDRAAYDVVRAPAGRAGEGLRGATRRHGESGRAGDCLWGATRRHGESVRSGCAPRYDPDRITSPNIIPIASACPLRSGARDQLPTVDRIEP